MQTYRADLHVHTVLSPCADVEMIPPLIIEAAKEKGISILAITDHNQTANIQAVMKAAVYSGISIIPGMELQTREEIHLLCLFDNLERSNEFQIIVDNALPALENDPEHFGGQFVVDETGEFIRSDDRMLLASTSLSIDQAVLIVHQLGGMAIPAHVDRKAYGLLNVLGFFPPSINFDAIEVSRFCAPEEIQKNPTYPSGTPIVQNGDVHFLSDFSGKCHFYLENPALSELKNAFIQENGRKLTMDEDIDKSHLRL